MRHYQMQCVHGRLLGLFQADVQQLRGYCMQHRAPNVYNMLSSPLFFFVCIFFHPFVPSVDYVLRWALLVVVHIVFVYSFSILNIVIWSP